MITWFASLINWIWINRFEWMKIRKGSLVFLAAGVAVIFFGFIRLNTISTGSKTVLTASIVNAREINSALATCKWDDAKSISPYSHAVEDNLLAKTEQAAVAGAKIVLWQESAGFIPRQEEKEFIYRAGLLAAFKKIYLLMTFWSVPEDYPKHLVENKLLILDTAGQIQLVYFKNNPAPPEPIKKGDGTLPVMETPYGKIAPAICVDAVFQRFIRQAGKSKAGILFLPANDWKAIDPIHTHMAVLRAIENGFSLVRAAGQGLSVATDNRGNIISSMDYFHTDEQIMYASVPAQHSNTVYTLFGDFFGWLCVLGFITMTVLAVWQKCAARMSGLRSEDHLNRDYHTGLSRG
jgi:apolipoprotein N-acyltransferase